MNIRKYNIYFHTHTISGIIICALLYVIFFAGSFSFFKDDIAAWQKNTTNLEHAKDLERDFNSILDSLGQKHNLTGRDISFYMQRSGAGAYVNMSSSHDTIVSKPEVNPKTSRRRGGGDGAYFVYNFAKKEAAEYSRAYDMGEFLYRLHFLAQLNQVPIRIGTPFGYLVAGIVSFLFLFALITGFFLHYEKIKSNFFVFRPFSKWKTVWTDVHTAMGVIGFPFQFIFAVTGVILIVNFALITPYSKVFYKGNSEQLYADLQYSHGETYAYSYTALQKKLDLNKFLSIMEKKWEGSELTRINIFNYGDENMHLLVEAKPLTQSNFAGSGKIVFRLKDGKVLSEKSPVGKASYIDQVKALVYHLHFGDFGGRPLRVVFFILGLMGCLVIISGILIWLVARDKNNIPAYKRKFNFWTANVFLASCLSMLPVTAITFIMIKVNGAPTQQFIYQVYFYTWLFMSLYFIARRNISLTNEQVLLLSTATCFLVPLANGLYANNWLWKTYADQKFDILFIDLLFLSLSLMSYFVYLKLWKKKNAVVSASKNAK